MPNPSEEKATADRLEMTAKLLRSSSQGLVGNARHWMKDAADDCIQAASELRAARKVREALEPEHKRWTERRFSAAHSIDIQCLKDGTIETYEGDFLKDVARALAALRPTCKRCHGRRYLIGDSEWAPYRVECPDCTARTSEKEGE